jgi:formylglycine-generating enzyme
MKRLGSVAVACLAPFLGTEASAQGLAFLREPIASRVYLEQVEFWMGSTPEEMVQAVADCVLEPLPKRCATELFQNEGPRHRVQLSGFWLDRFEVSVEAYARCVQAEHCDPVPYGSGARRFERPDFPVTLVRYTDAVAYCSFVRGSLPTEAQFERAARGVDQRRYPWGNLYNPRRSNHGKLAFDSTDRTDGYAELAPTHAFRDGATPEQVYNLAGNVEEWVLDRYAAEYPAAPQRDPVGPDESAGATDRVVRGGSFRTAAPWLRSAARTSAEPESRSATRGFRCAYPPS